MEKISIVTKNHSYWMAEREAEFQRVVYAKFNEILTALLLALLVSGFTALFIPKIDLFFYACLSVSGIFGFVGHILVAMYLERFEKRFENIGG